jgi:hypothetical protein
MNNIVIITAEAATQACLRDIVEHGSKNLMRYVSSNGCIIFNNSYRKMDLNDILCLCRSSSSLTRGINKRP